MVKRSRVNSNLQALQNDLLIKCLNMVAVVGNTKLGVSKRNSKDGMLNIYEGEIILGSREKYQAQVTILRSRR